MNTKWKSKREVTVWVDENSWHDLDGEEVIEVTTDLSNLKSYDFLKKIPLNQLENHVQEVPCIYNGENCYVMDELELYNYYERIE